MSKRGLEESVVEQAPQLQASDIEAYFEHGPIACLVVAPDALFTVLAASDAYLRATHLRREDVVGRPFLSLFPDNPASPDTPGSHAVRASLERVRNTRTPEVMGLVRYDIRREGESRFEERYWSPAHTPLLGRDGEVRHIVHQVEDMTQVVQLARQRDASVAELQSLKLALQVQAERERLLGELEAARAEAEAQREQLRRVVEASGTGTWDVDLASGRLTADARHRALLGLPPEGPLTMEQAMQAIRPQHRAAVQQTVSEALGGAHGGRYFTTFRVSGSEERWVEGRGQALFDAAGRAVRLLGTSVDITSRKQAEEALRLREAEFRMLAEALPVAVWVAAPNGDHLYVNQTFLRLTGLRHEQVLGRGYEQVLHPEDATRALAAWQQAVATRAPFESEHRVRTPEGQFRWHLARAVPLLDEAGQVVRWIGTSVDVHELRQAQAQVQQRADFEQQLIGIVSHDLRTPLSSILLGAQALLRSDTLGDRQTRSVVRIQSAAERAVRMVRDLLDFTQARLGGGLPVARAPMDLRALVPQAVDELQLTHPERDVQVEHEGDVTGAWDADRIAQVLVNLLTNALTYSPPGSTVRVSTRGEADAVLLAVHNEGHPLPPELLERLFQPMQRGAPQAGASGRSVGLGLYIVDQVVRAHGGSVSVRSEAAEGTTFTVRLPRAVT